MTNDGYLNAYRKSVAEHGSGFGATLWASPRTQHLRFEVFKQMCAMGGKRVLDAGCSRGDFAAYLLGEGVVFERYVGVDALVDVIEFAQGRGLAGCEFHAGDFVASPRLMRIGDPQVVCISGALNTMSDGQVKGVLEAAWEAAGQSLLFNFLSDRAGSGAPQQAEPARRLDTMGLMDWALKRTPRVAMRQDYFPNGHDATIMMGK